VPIKTLITSDAEQHSKSNRIQLDLSEDYETLCGFLLIPGRGRYVG